MTEGSDGKRQLGRILLQRKLVTADELEDLLAQQRAQGSRLASTVAESGKVEAAELLSALSEQQGLPAIDLRRVVIALEHLALVPVDIARQHLVMPLLVKDDSLFLAMADPDNRRIIDELEFATGKRIFPYVALHGALRDVLEAVYAAAQAGQAQYMGPLVQGQDAQPPRPRPSMIPGQDAALVTAGHEGGPQWEDELSRPHLLEAEAEHAKNSQPQASARAPAASPKRKILVVDDNDDTRQLLCRAFGERDFEVRESSHGLDALQQVRDFVPDVLVLEAMLPEVHGFDICRRIKGSRRYGQIPVIMVSAVYRGWRVAEDLRQSYGVSEFLEKPFRVGEVVAVVERVLSGSSHLAGQGDPGQDELEGAAGELLRAGIDAYAQGDLGAAVEHLKRGIVIDPLAFRLHYHLGLLYGKQDNVFEAIQALETAADLRPRDFSTLKNLAVLYQRAGFRLKATEMWERALGSAPDDDTRVNIKNHLVSLL